MWIVIVSVCQPLAEIPALAAQDRRFDLDIPAGTLASSLAALSIATGASIGYPGALPLNRTPLLRGRMTVSEALRRLLIGTHLTAISTGQSAFRLQRLSPPRPVLPPQRPKPRLTPTPPQSDQIAPDIIVTGQKRPQILGEVPMSIAVISLGNTAGRMAPGGRDLALSIEGLALTNLGPGRNRQFIRGVADSPFIGPSQSTVAVQLDEARVTFDAPDPDLRLLDVERVEILKGPQGPLYGSGALGGIYHIVTRRPVLDESSASTRILGETVAHGGPGIGAEGVLNLPIVRESLALRAVGYASREGGWINNSDRKDNANVARTYGGRLALRWRPSPDWTIDLGATAQYVNVADSQYVTTSATTLRRYAPIAEPTDNDFRSVNATVEGHLGALKLLSATSHVAHSVDFTLDASASAAAFGTSAPVVYRDDRSYAILNQEFRVSPADDGHWLAGASFLRAKSHSEAVLRDIDGTPRFPVETLDRIVTEYAVFGEGTLPVARRVNATAGLRLFRTIAEDEALERSGSTKDSIGKTILSPSLALSWAPRGDTIAYLRYARSLRPGGLAADERMQATRYDADELGTIDLGIRHEPAGGRLTYNASIFLTQWSDIQSDYLLTNGLVATHNAGRARIVGIEAGGDWAPLKATHLSGGISYQDARLTYTQANIEVDDRRLPVAPDVTGRAAIRQDFTFTGWQSSVTGQVNYIGRARLTFDSDIDRSMGRYATSSIAASFTKAATNVAIRLDNMFDVRGDSFAFGNPFSIRTTQQYTPLRPRTLTLSVGRSW